MRRGRRGEQMQMVHRREARVSMMKIVGRRRSGACLSDGRRGNMCVCVHRYVCVLLLVYLARVLLREDARLARGRRGNSRVGMQMRHRRKDGDVWHAVWEKHSSQLLARREKRMKEEELCWGRDALPKRYDGNGRRLYFDERSRTYLSGDTSREQGVHVRCDLLCPGVLFGGPKCLGWIQSCEEILGLAAFQGRKREKHTVRMTQITGSLPLLSNLDILCEMEHEGPCCSPPSTLQIHRTAIKTPPVDFLF